MGGDWRRRPAKEPLPVGGCSCSFSGGWVVGRWCFCLAPFLGAASGLCSRSGGRWGGLPAKSRRDEGGVGMGGGGHVWIKRLATHPAHRPALCLWPPAGWWLPVPAPAHGTVQATPPTLPPESRAGLHFPGDPGTAPRRGAPGVCVQVARRCRSLPVSPAAAAKRGARVTAAAAAPHRQPAARPPPGRHAHANFALKGGWRLASCCQAPVHSAQTPALPSRNPPDRGGPQVRTYTDATPPSRPRLLLGCASACQAAGGREGGWARPRRMTRRSQGRGWSAVV